MARFKEERSYETNLMPRSHQKQTQKRAVSYSNLSPPPTYEQVEKLDALPYRQSTSAVPPHPQTIILSNPDIEVTVARDNHISQINCTDPSGHTPKRQFGKIGILAGVVFFPWGLFWTRCDSQVVCRSCHTILKPKGCKRHCREMTYSGCMTSRGRRYGGCGYGRQC